MNDVLSLMETGADLLESLEQVYGVQIGFHRDNTPGIGVIVSNGEPVTQNVGCLDYVACALKAGIECERSGPLSYYAAVGSWRGVPVRVSQLMPDRGRFEHCTLTALQTSWVVRDLMPVVRKVDPLVLSSVHVGDRGGVPSPHLVLLSDDWSGSMRRAADGAVLFEREGGEFVTQGAYGELVLADGMSVSIVSTF